MTPHRQMHLLRRLQNGVVRLRAKLREALELGAERGRDLELGRRARQSSLVQHAVDEREERVEGAL